jgi:hypothetical protein
LLVFGEGLGEEIFIRCIRGVYAQETGPSVKIRAGKGGCPEEVVNDAWKLNLGLGYDRIVVVFDNDKPKEEMLRARKFAKEKSIDVIEHSPCLESILLRILKEPNIPVGRSSKFYKDIFEKKYISKKRRGDLDEYMRVFPNELLNDARLSVPELDALIRVIAGE